MGLQARFILGSWDKKGSGSALASGFNLSQVQGRGKRDPATPKQASISPILKVSQRVTPRAYTASDLRDTGNFWKKVWLLSLSVAGISVCHHCLGEGHWSLCLLTVFTNCIYTVHIFILYMYLYCIYNCINTNCIYFTDLFV